MKTRSERKDLEMFGGNRLKALERDGFKCASCGMTDADHRGRKTQDKNNDLSNLRTLCLSCHGAKDSNRRWRAFYEVRDINQHGTALWYNKRGCRCDLCKTWRRDQSRRRRLNAR